MRKNNIKLRTLFFMLLTIVMIKTNAQTGLNFQGVARTTNNVILASQAVTIKLSILQGSATGTLEYTETRRVITNAQGLFTAVIGDTGAISTLGNFTTINWKLSPKFLKIEMDPTAGTNFITMGTTQFQYVAYAQFAKSVDAENIVGIVPVILGGTGVNSLTGLKTALTLNNVNNTSDLNKPISTLTQIALDLKLNTADTSKYTKQNYIDSSLLTKLKISDTAAMLSSRIARDTLNLSNRINLKINTTDVTSVLDLKLNKADTIKFTKQTYSDSALLTKLKISDTAAMLSSRIARDTLNLSNRINLKANTLDVSSGLDLKLYKADTIKFTKQTYTDSALLTKLKISDTAAMLSSRIARDTLSLSNRINLKANTTDVTTSLSLKENILNKSSAVDLGSGATSDILFPTQKAVKTYVDGQINSGGITDGGILTRHLADGAVTGIKLSNSISGYKKFFDGAGNVTISSSVVIDVLIPTGAVATGGISNWQSFTAGMSGKLSLVEFETSNPNSTGPAATVYVEVYSGQGLSGTLLGTSATQTIAGFGNTWKIFDFGLSNIEVLSGNVYTARIVTNSSDQNWLYGGNATYTSGISNVSSTWDHNIKTSVRQYNDDPYLTVGLASNLYGGLVSNATHTGDVSGSTILSITASSNSTLTSLPNLATVGTITSGVWSGTAVAVEKGGTGATTASAARTNLGLVIGTNVQAPLTAGTDYLVPTGSAASLTNFPTFNQSTTGNAATATTAGNITATTNTTLTSLSNLATVGTITSGVWSGTAVAVEKGGTGLTAVGTNGQVLTSTGSGTLTWTTPATSSSNNSNELTGIIIFGKNTSNVNEVWKSNFDGSSKSKINIAGLPANYEIPSDSYKISADGQTIFFLLYTPTGGQHIYKCNIDGSGLSKIINDVDEIGSVSGFYSPNTTHSVGESYGGGKVFYVTTNGLHGLIAETQDQSNDCNWYAARDIISISANHSDAGKLFTDWRLPTNYELNLMYVARSSIGGFTNNLYWSSKEDDASHAWYQHFGSGAQNYVGKANTLYVRAIRAF
jgi:hypothetical protein